MRTDAPAARTARAAPSRLPSLTTPIFIGLLLGIAVGYLWPSFGVAIKPLADVFLRMIKMIIAPLLFSTLVVGVAGTGDLKAMAQNQQHAWDIVLHMFPTSVIDSMARGDILQVVVFALFFGIALAAIGA